MKEIFRVISPSDPRLTPVIAALFNEYKQMYGDYFSRENEVDAPEQYSPARGLFLILERDEQIIATGAYKEKDATTAEIKRIWTHQSLRKQGIAKKMLHELERRAHEAGYNNLFLSTGFKQLSAVQLYLKEGYEPLFDITKELELYSIPPFDGKLRFGKKISNHIVDLTG